MVKQILRSVEGGKSVGLNIDRIAEERKHCSFINRAKMNGEGCPPD